MNSSDRYTSCAYCDGCCDVSLREGVSVGDAICQLADYENTGLSPEEIIILISEKEYEHENHINNN